MLIRQTIEQAQCIEAETRALNAHIRSCLPELHQSIKFKDIDSESALSSFLLRYIEHVPDFLDALIDITQSAGIYSVVEKIVDVIQSYFVEPPEMPNDHQGLFALVDEAYLAHRLMEEMNDRIMMACGVPLIPMDMTLSNIIVHSVLGEKFANELDMAVHYAIEVLYQDLSAKDFPKFQAYIALHKADGWTDVLTEWPCLAGDESITLDIEYQPAVMSLSKH